MIAIVMRENNKPGRKLPAMVETALHPRPIFSTILQSDANGRNSNLSFLGRVRMRRGKKVTVHSIKKAKSTATGYKQRPITAPVLKKACYSISKDNFPCIHHEEPTQEPTEEPTQEPKVHNTVKNMGMVQDQVIQSNRMPRMESATNDVGRMQKNGMQHTSKYPSTNDRKQPANTDLNGERNMQSHTSIEGT